MKAPKYVVDLMKRAEYSYNQGCAPGYTVRIWKKTDYTMVDTLRKECERLVKWANKIAPETATLDSCPTKTHYWHQYATVTIYDPVMKSIESHITR